MRYILRYRTILIIKFNINTIAYVLVYMHAERTIFFIFLSEAILKIQF